MIRPRLGKTGDLMFTVYLSCVCLLLCAFGVVFPDGGECGSCWAGVVAVGTLSTWSYVVMCFNKLHHLQFLMAWTRPKKESRGSTCCRETLKECDHCFPVVTLRVVIRSAKRVYVYAQSTHHLVSQQRASIFYRMDVCIYDMKQARSMATLKSRKKTQS